MNLTKGDLVKNCKIKITSHIYNRCTQFAHKRVEDSAAFYASRGPLTSRKAYDDILTGALGEFAVYKYLHKRGIKCSKPDLEIKTLSNKSYAADLVADGANIHVKSQSRASYLSYGSSWLVQRSDLLHAAPDINDWIAFTRVDLDAKEVTILGFCLATDINSRRLWAECRVPMFRKTKVALYLNDLQEILF